MQKNYKAVIASIIAFTLIFNVPITAQAASLLSEPTALQPQIATTTAIENSPTATQPTSIVTDFFAQASPLSAVAPCTTEMCGVIAGQTVSGTIFVQPNLDLNPDIRKVAYYLNGTLSTREYISPFIWGGSAGFDTTKLQDGNYTLGGAYTTKTGDKAFSIALTVKNAASTDTTPPVISAVNSTNITTIGATINWTTNEASDSQVEYRVQGTTTWTLTSNTSLVTNHTIAPTGLSANTIYQYQVKSKDAAGNTATQATISTFTTQASDTTPPVISAVTSTNITSGDATINWTTNEASDSQVEYRIQGQTPWLASALNATLVTNHTLTLSGLNASTTYEYRVKSKDGSGNLATQATISTFATSAATSCMTNFCGVTNGQTVSGVITVKPNLTLHPSVRKVFYYLNGSQSGKYYSAPFIWGGVNGTGNMGFDTNTLTNGNYTLAGSYADNTGDHAFSITFTVNNTPGDSTPPVISAVGSNNITPNGATINWTTNEASDSQVEYRVQGQPSWQASVLNAALVTTHALTISGLNPSTVYEYRVKSKDATGNLATQATISSFTTLPDTTPPVVSAVVSSNVTSTEATISWTTNEASDSQVEYRVQGSIAWLATSINTALVTNHTVALINMAIFTLMTPLSPNTIYEYQVKSQDQAGNLATQSPISNFKTAASTIPSSTPIAPAGRTLGGLQFPPATTSFVDIDHAGNLSFLADTKSLYIVDAANPSAPRLLSTVDFSTPLLDIVATPDGTAVFVLERGLEFSDNGYVYFRNRLWRVNVSDPSNPILEWKDILNDARRLHLGSNTVWTYFFSSGETGVVSCPVEGGACSKYLAGPNYIKGELVYGGVWADIGNFYISNSSHDLTNTPTAAPVAFFSGKENYLFVSLKNGTVPVYDVNQTSMETGQIPVVKTIDPQGNDPIFNLIFGNRLAVLDSTGLIEIFDITNPLNSTRVDFVTVAGARSLDYDGRNLYVVTDNQYRIIALPDTTAPVISAVAAGSITASGATINWTTNEVSDSQVQYRVQGATAWLNTTLNASLVTNHSVLLNGLNASTIYQYQVKSKDQAGNQAIQTSVSNFQTIAATQNAFLETGGVVVMEGESFFGSTAVNGQMWSLTNYAAGSNGQGLLNGPDLGQVINTITGPRADFKFYVNNPGTFYVWLRGYAKDGMSDSLHVGLNGQFATGGSRVSNFIYDGSAASWTNRNMDQLRVSFTVNTPGENTLNLWMREDGLLVDKIVITQDANFVPTGLGSAESARVLQSDTTPPAVVLDVGTPHLINTKSFTINYTSDGVAKQKIFTNLLEGANALTFTETDLAGNQTVVNWNVTVNTSLATFTWINDGIGANLWSNGANWLGGIAPGATDTAVFGPYSSSGCVIDTAITAANMTIASGYTGTITLQANINVTGNFAQLGGTFTANGQSVTVGGVARISAGTYHGGTGTQNFNTDLIIEGGTFMGGTGTVNIGRDATITSGVLNTGAQTINVVRNLSFAGGTVDATGATLDVDGNFNWSGGYVAKSPTLLRLAGNWSRTGGDATTVGSPSTVEFNGSADQSYYDSGAGGGYVQFYNVTYSGHHTVHFYSDLYFMNIATIAYSDGWINLHGHIVYAYPGYTIKGAGQSNIIP